MKSKTNDTPVGFGSYAVEDDLSYSDFKLLLPCDVIEAIKIERATAEEQEKSEPTSSDKSKVNKSAEKQDFTPYKSRSNIGLSDLNVDLETAALLEAAANTVSLRYNTPVYDVLEPLKLISEAKGKTPDKDIHKRNESLYKQLKLKGHLRTLAYPEDLPTHLEHLRRCFPHFSCVLDLVKDQYSLSKLSTKPFSIPPILLGGSPGIGKTRFTQDLAKALGTPMRRHSFDNNQSGSSLLGSDRHWANTSYGLVFDMVVLGQHANPVVLLDEIDKASRREGVDPLASLHSLLEPVTSMRVRDLSVELEFNASHVIWIATANDLTRIPESLRSRFQVFCIDHPSGAQSLQMAEVIAEEVHKEIGVPKFEPPSRKLVHFIAHLTAREQTHALRRAYSAAISSGRNHLLTIDLPEEVRREANEFSGEADPPIGTLH